MSFQAIIVENQVTGYTYEVVEDGVVSIYTFDANYELIGTSIEDDAAGTTFSNLIEEVDGGGTVESGSQIEGDYSIRYKSLYTVNQRVAQRFYDGRIVLVGDACHINNPLGGMGMNGGIHDAYDLASRLIRVMRSEEEYLAEFEKYDVVRRSLASRFVQEHTIANKAVMESTDPDIQKSRQALLMKTAADPALAKDFMMERSMINSVRETMGKI